VKESKRESLFSMFKGFMDESGIGPADKACTVAGFVASEAICNFKNIPHIFSLSDVAQFWCNE
jgi:hypothetical protein